MKRAVELLLITAWLIVAPEAGKPGAPLNLAAVGEEDKA